MVYINDVVAGVAITMPYILTAITIVVSVRWLYDWQQLAAKRRLYNQWIRRARNERGEKVHKVPLEPAEADTPSLTAEETRRRILSGKLDARQNVVRLAHRCRLYGRESVANAITEEYYDEAAESATKFTPPRWPQEAPPLF